MNVVVEQQPTHTEARLDSLERSSEKTNLRLSSVESTLTSLVGDVKQLLAAVGAVQSRPQFDLFKSAQLALVAIGIFTASVSGITYVVNAVNAAENVALQKEVEFLRKRVDNGWGIGGVTIQPKGNAQ